MEIPGSDSESRAGMAWAHVILRMRPLHQTPSPRVGSGVGCIPHQFRSESGILVGTMAEKFRFPVATPPLSHTKVGVGSGQNPGFRADVVWDAAHTTSDCGTGGLLELGVC